MPPVSLQIGGLGCQGSIYAATTKSDQSPGEKLLEQLRPCCVPAEGLAG